MCVHVYPCVCTCQCTCVEVRRQPELILSFYHVFPRIEFRSSGLVVNLIHWASSLALPLTSEAWYIEVWYIPDVLSVQTGTLSTTCCNLEWGGVKVLQPDVFTVESARRNCLCHGSHVWHGICPCILLVSVLSMWELTWKEMVMFWLWWSL